MKNETELISNSFEDMVRDILENKIMSKWSLKRFYRKTLKSEIMNMSKTELNKTFTTALKSNDKIFYTAMWIRWHHDNGLLTKHAMGIIDGVKLKPESKITRVKRIAWVVTYRLIKKVSKIFD